MDGKPSLTGVWSGHVNHLNFGEHQPYLRNSWSYSGQVLRAYRLYQVPVQGWQITLKRAWSGSRDPLKFRYLWNG